LVEITDKVDYVTSFYSYTSVLDKGELYSHEAGWIGEIDGLEFYVGGMHEKGSSIALINLPQENKKWYTIERETPQEVMVGDRKYTVNFAGSGEEQFVYVSGEYNGIEIPIQDRGLEKMFDIHMGTMFNGNGKDGFMAYEQRKDSVDIITFEDIETCK